MNTQPIREYLSRGETGDALRALIALLEPDKRYRNNLLRIARLNEADYNVVRQKELKGLLSFPEAQREYTRLNDALLAVLDELEEGRLPTGTTAPGKRRYLPWIAGVIVVLATIAGSRQYLRYQAEAAAWRHAVEQHTRPAYLEYRNRYPEHAHTLDAADSLTALDKRIQYLAQSVRAFIAADAYDEATNALEKMRKLDPENPEIKRLSEQLPK